MSGRKTFTAGEVLQAADVNDFLMDQSVMVFGGTAARGSAIPSPTEGMVTYREDDNVVEVFDGSSYKPVGGLVAVKHALKTDAEAFTGITATNNVAVTGLSITHEVADPANKLIITAFFGMSATGGNAVGIAVHDGTGLLALGDASGQKSRITAGGFQSYTNQRTYFPSITFVHTPGAGSKTYTVRAINVSDLTQTLWINRSERDDNSQFLARGASGFVIQEVAV